MTFTGAVDERGRLDPDVRGQVAEYIRTFAGKRIDVKIRAEKRQRTLKQNARHWALMTVAAKSLWEDPSEKDTLHEELAHLYFALPPCPKTGMRRRRRTPDANTKEFAEFHEWCVDKLIELGADLTEWDAQAEHAA